VEAVLADLAMAGARFDVRMHWTPLSAAASSSSSSSSASSSLVIEAADAAGCLEREGAYRMRPGGAGLDAAEFLFAAGPAEPLRALSVASGGESARIMLALKAAPAFMLAADDGSIAAEPVDSDHTSSTASSSSSSSSSSSGSSAGDEASVVAGAGQILVLDEVDSGIGSRLGQPIGRILRRMAGTAGGKAGQLLVVSHLPQVSKGAQLSAASCQHLAAGWCWEQVAGSSVAAPHQAVLSA
jgi:DNA repair ATPase RecN